MAKVRSPNYPNVSLRTALDYTRTVFEAEHHNKRIPRTVVGEHLGHQSLSGPALGKIGAMRAYGLLEGSGNELRVTEDAVAAMEAPEGSIAQREAIGRLAFQPTLFQDIRKDFPDSIPSDQSLQWWLIQHQFTKDAAWIAAKSFRETMQLVQEVGGSYSSSQAEAAPSTTVGPNLTNRSQFFPPVVTTYTEPKPMEGERELKSGLLSKDASFRLLVRGQIGPKEIERLIASLELDKEILAETEKLPADVEELLGPKSN